MKKNKDPRINAKNMSLPLYLLMLVGFAAILGNHTWIIMYFTDRGMNITHLRLVVTVLMAYTFITAFLYMISIALAKHFMWNRPIRIISEAARKIATGDFSVRIPPLRKDGKKDYVEVMFEDFNYMVEELESSTEKLKSLSMTDELTRLNNRRSFLEYIDLIWKQNHRLNLLDFTPAGIQS